MSSDHPPNIFRSLFRFQPSKGEKRLRRPKEDFTTEALAYLLERSRQFQKGFFSLLRSADILEKSVFSIETQHSCEECRADLAIIESGDAGVKIGIEVKIDAGYQPEQLERYGYFDRRFLIAPEWRLYDDDTYCKKHNVQAISWQEIQRCAEVAAETAMKSEPAESDLLSQFSNYLIYLGLNTVIMNTDPQTIGNIAQSISTFNEWTAFLESLYGKLGFGSPHDPPRWEKDKHDDRIGFYGIYDSLRKHPFRTFGYAGFKCRGEGIELFFQEVRPAGRQKLTSSEHLDLDEAGNAWITETCAYPNVKPDSMASELTRLFKDLQRQAKERADGLGLESQAT